MIVTVGNTKGGVGKTTVALNLAIAQARAGRDVWFIDGDRQGTAQAAIALRAESERAPAIACASYPDGSTLRSQVLHQTGKFADIIIDAGGRDSGALRAALILSDVLLVPFHLVPFHLVPFHLVPFHPRTYDVWALDDMAALVEEACAVRDGLRVKAVLNCADPGNRSKDNIEAAAAVGELERFEYLPTPLRRRKAFANAAGAGLSVLELTPPDRKAIAELNALVNILF